MSDQVTVVNALSVPPAEAERMLRYWKQSAQVMAGRPGFIRAQMLRSVTEDAEPLFVNTSQWESRQAFANARASAEWQAVLTRMREDPELHVTSRPGVYEVAVDVEPGYTA